MDIIKASLLLKDGKKIRRSSWKDKEAHILFEPKNHLLVNGYREYFRPAIDTLQADDWEEYIEHREIPHIPKATGQNFCWHCGSYENLTRHHLQLKKFRSLPIDKDKVRGGVIPLCKDCHVGVERIRSNAEKIYKERHKKLFMDYISTSHLITKKQKDKLLPQIIRIWEKKEDDG